TAPLGEFFLAARCVRLQSPCADGMRHMSPMTRRTAGVLLAGGRSRRMGREKPLQIVGGVSLIERVRAAVSHCVDETVLVTNRPDLYAFLGLPMIPDTYPERGPLAGLLAALEYVRAPAPLVLAADYPLLDPGAR